MENTFTSSDITVMYSTAVGVEDSKKGKTRCIKSMFKTVDCFVQYINKYSRQKVVAECWLRFHMEINAVVVNHTGV